ncbi:MAG TPA: hypothetical protein DGH68_11110 [Bacteroidetes bacterium]|nr:hypothetical protein [Bacteroidota bacterium]
MSELPSTVPVAPKAKRLDYIDLLRGWAVIVMIETHVFNATLTREITEGGLYGYITFINGLVAPSFLFASGLAYAVTTRRKLNDYLSFGQPLLKQVGRLLLILAIGYLLHLPKFNYVQIMSVTEERPWRIFFQADVLQCIAVSLLFMQALLLLLRSERRLCLTLIAVTAGVVFLTPIVWGIDFWPILPAPLAGYLNGIYFKNFPGFPLFPWSAFLFAGAIVGYFYQESRTSTEQEFAMMKWLLWWSLGLILASFVIHPVAALVYPTYDYWRFSPSFYLLRLGIVIALCVGMFFYEKRQVVSQRSPVTLIGRESLIVYATHLLLIFGNFSSFNFSKHVNHTFGYGEAIITTILLMGLMYALALFWSRIKRGSPRWRTTLQFGTLAVLVGVFFFGPGE